nr:hypothetical protein BaRGS_022050 [Batillaria attramentaria]
MAYAPLGAMGLSRSNASGAVTDNDNENPTTNRDRMQVVCIGFSYIADHPNAEYSAIRLMGQGIGSHMMSPQLFPHGENVSINSTCDLEGPSGRRQLDIGLRYIVLVLLNGQRIVFSCETRDSNRYVIRSQGFPSPDKDSFLCVHFKPMEDDPFYDYVFSRLNSQY